ncbi:hypothetical protein ES707_10327 [subsurface metagenome]
MVELADFLVRVKCPECGRGFDVRVEADSLSEARRKMMGKVVTCPIDHGFRVLEDPFSPWFKVTPEALIGISELLSPKEVEKRMKVLYDALKVESRKVGVPPVVELKERPLYPIRIKDYDRARITVRVGVKNEGYFAGRWLVREKVPYNDGYLIRVQRENVIKGHDRVTDEPVTDTEVLGWEYPISNLEWKGYEKTIRLVKATLRNQVYALMLTTFIPKTITIVATALGLTRNQVRSKFDDLVKEGKIMRSKSYPTAILGEARYELLRPIKHDFVVAELKRLSLPPEAYLMFPPRPKEQVISLSRYVS